MLIIPAIDLKDGKCVRLKQGRMDESTIFSDNPAEMARHWVEQGARRLHLVDWMVLLRENPSMSAPLNQL